MFTKEHQQSYLEKKIKIAQITLEETLKFCKNNREDIVIVTLDAKNKTITFKVLDIKSFKIQNKTIHINSFRTLAYKQKLAQRKNTPIDKSYLAENFSEEILNSINLEFFDQNYLVSPGVCEYTLDNSRFINNISLDSEYNPLQDHENLKQIYKIASVFLPNEIGVNIANTAEFSENIEYDLVPTDYCFNNEEVIDINTIIACFSDQIGHSPYFNMLSYNDAEALDISFALNYIKVSRDNQEREDINKEDFYLPDLPYILNLNAIINNFIKKTSLASYSSIYRNEALHLIDDGVITKGKAPSSLSLYNNACLVDSHLSFLVSNSNYKTNSIKDLQVKLKDFQLEENKINPSLISVENYILDPLASIYNLLLGKKVLSEINDITKSYFSLTNYKSHNIPFKSSLNQIIKEKGYDESITESLIYALNPEYSLSHFSPLYPIELFHASLKNEKEPLYTIADESLKVFIKDLIEEFSIRYFKLYTNNPNYLELLDKLEKNNKVAMLAAYILSRNKNKFSILNKVEEKVNDRRYLNYYKAIVNSAQEEINYFKSSLKHFYGYPLANYDNFNCDYSYNYLYNLIHNSYHYRQSALPLSFLPGSPTATTQASSPQGFLSFLDKDNALDSLNFRLLGLKLENYSLKEFFANLFTRMQKEVWEESDLLMNLNETTFPDKFAPNTIRHAPNRGFTDYFAQGFSTLPEVIREKRKLQINNDNKLPFYHLMSSPNNYGSDLVNSSFAFLQNRIYCGALSTRNPSYTAEGYCAEIVRSGRFISIMVPYSSIIDISYEDKVNIFNIKSPEFGLNIISPAASILSSNTLILTNSLGIKQRLQILKQSLKIICSKISNIKSRNLQ